MTMRTEQEQYEIHEDLLEAVEAEMPDDEELFDLAELFKIFGDSTRVKILYVLLQKEMSVTEIATSLNMSQPAISQQLRVLKANGLVRYTRDGKSLIYSLSDEHVKLILNIGLEHLGDR